MLLSFPTTILIAIVVIVIAGVILFIFLCGIYNARQKEIIEKEPKRIKKKSDVPELPSDGQEDEPFDKTNKKLDK